MSESTAYESSFDTAWFGDCGNTFHEEQKQLVYASRMGLQAIWEGAHPPSFDLQRKSIMDIGGGPVSLLLKCVNRSIDAAVVDPGQFPPWVEDRYAQCGIQYWRARGEDIPFKSGHGNYDEVWIYNTLQHVDDVELVIANARAWSDTLRIFEWIDIEPYPGHPQKLTHEFLESVIGVGGFSAPINEYGAVGRAFYGVYDLAA